MSFPTFKQLPLQTQITVILGLLLIAASAFVAKKPFWGILSLAFTYLLYAYTSWCLIRGGCNAFAWLNLVIIAIASIGALLVIAHITENFTKLPDKGWAQGLTYAPWKPSKKKTNTS